MNTNKNEKNVLTRKKIKDTMGQMVFILDYFIRQKNSVDVYNIILYNGINI